jgi:hypothetical protein
LNVSGTTAGIERGQLLTVPLDLEAIVERVALPADRTWNHIAMHLEVFVLPGRRLSHDFIDVLVVLHALAERRVHEDAECGQQHDRGDAYLCGFVAHK